MITKNLALWCLVTASFLAGIYITFEAISPVPIVSAQTGACDIDSLLSTGQTARACVCESGDIAFNFAGVNCNFTPPTIIQNHTCSVDGTQATITLQLNNRWYNGSGYVYNIPDSLYTYPIRIDRLDNGLNDNWGGYTVRQGDWYIDNLTGANGTVSGVGTSNSSVTVSSDESTGRITITRAIEPNQSYRIWAHARYGNNSFPQVDAWSPTSNIYNFNCPVASVNSRLNVQWREHGTDTWKDTDGTIPSTRSSIQLQYRSDDVTSCQGYLLVSPYNVNTNNTGNTSWGDNDDNNWTWFPDSSVDAPPQGETRRYFMRCDRAGGGNIGASVDITRSNPAAAQCADGIDNDGDGWIDYSAGTTGDPGCTGPSDPDESPQQCNDPTATNHRTGWPCTYPPASGGETISLTFEWEKDNNAVWSNGNTTITDSTNLDVRWNSVCSGGRTCSCSEQAGPSSFSVTNASDEDSSITNSQIALSSGTEFRVYCQHPDDPYVNIARSFTITRLPPPPPPAEEETDLRCSAPAGLQLANGQSELSVTLHSNPDYDDSYYYSLAVFRRSDNVNVWRGSGAIYSWDYAANNARRVYDGTTFAPGDYRLEVTVDQYDWQTESNESNNVCSGNFTVTWPAEPPYPDFTPIIPTGRAVNGEPSTLNVRFENIGSNPGDIPVQMEIDYDYDGTFVADAATTPTSFAIAAGGARTLTDTRVWSLGTHAVRGRVDPDGTSSDSNDSNDIGPVFVFTVLNGPDLTPSVTSARFGFVSSYTGYNTGFQNYGLFRIDNSFPSNTPSIAEAIVINGVITNIGDATGLCGTSADRCKFSLLTDIGGTLRLIPIHFGSVGGVGIQGGSFGVGFGQILSIAARNPIRYGGVDYELYRGQCRTYALVADSENDMLESNESNNMASIQFGETCTQSGTLQYSVNGGNFITAPAGGRNETIEVGQEVRFAWTTNGYTGTQCALTERPSTLLSNALNQPVSSPFTNVDEPVLNTSKTFDLVCDGTTIGAVTFAAVAASGPPSQCDDGIDNDGDGYSDHDGDGGVYGPDPDCSGGPGDPGDPEPNPNPPLAPTVTVTASPNPVAQVNDPTTITWSAGNPAADCEAVSPSPSDFSIGTVNNDAGSQAHAVPANNTTYQIACTVTGPTGLESAPGTGSVVVGVTGAVSGSCEPANLVAPRVINSGGAATITFDPIGVGCTCNVVVNGIPQPLAVGQSTANTSPLFSDSTVQLQCGTWTGPTQTIRVRGVFEEV